MIKDKKLYRKRNTHWRTGQLCNYYNYTGSKYSYDRHTKKSKQDFLDEVRHAKMKKRSAEWKGFKNVDYTPLLMFLEESVGRKWEDVWKEAMRKSDNAYMIIQWVVLNINKAGLVCNRINRPFTDHDFIRAGEGSYYSSLYVDENGILQLADSDVYQQFQKFEKGQKYTNYDDEWSNTLNGKRLLHTTSRQYYKFHPQKKKEKKLNYSSFDEDLIKKNNTNETKNLQNNTSVD